MQAMPHRYRAAATAGNSGNIDLTSPGLASLVTAPPAEFGGPGDLWSPETLLVAAVADCFVLTFRAIARASKLDWVAIDCQAEGVLDRVDGVTRFTRMEVHAALTVPAGTSESLAERLLEKAEKGCLVTNSLLADRHLTVAVTTVG
jgi:organic hydroperoxide reductase OsmC/OhrA